MSAKSVCVKVGTTAFLGLTLASGFVWTIASGVHSSHIAGARASQVADTARASCKAVDTSRRPGFAKVFQKECSAAVDRGQYNNHASYDPTTMTFWTDEQGNRSFHNGLSYAQKEWRVQIRGEFNKLALWEEQKWALNTAVRNAVFNDGRPLAQSNVWVDIKSVKPVIAADGKDTGKYSGAFKVIVTEPGSTTPGRVFEYDHATGMISQTLDSSVNPSTENPASNTVSFHMENKCDGDKQMACAIVKAVNGALSSFPADQIKMLQKNIEGATAYNQQGQASGNSWVNTEEYINMFPALKM